MRSMPELRPEMRGRQVNTGVWQDAGTTTSVLEAERSLCQRRGKRGATGARATPTLTEGGGQCPPNIGAVL